MKDSIYDIIAGSLLFAGLFLMIGGLLLYMGGTQLPTRGFIAAGAVMVFGVFLYCQFREVDDEHLDDGQ